jgi:hypothetical protein
MARSTWFRKHFVALLCVGCCACLQAQNTTDTIYHLHGTVRNGVTDKPIGRALVTSGDRRLAAMTDNEGRFEIDLSIPLRPSSSGNQSTSQAGGVRSGILSLTAQRPGYLFPEGQTALTMDASLNTTDIAIKLMPTSAVSGRVIVAGTDAPRGVRVELLMRTVQEGAFVWQMIGTHVISSDGTFHFTNLQPGEYSLMTAEWAGGEPVAAPSTAVTKRYPPDFLGDTRTLAGAAKLHLRYGDEERAELHLHAASYFPVAVPVQNQPANAPINVQLTGTDTFNGYQLAWNARDGSIEGALPSGSYTLLLTSFGPQQGSALVPLTVSNEPLRHAPVTLAAGNRIPVRVQMQFTQNGASASTAFGYAGPPGGAPTTSNPLQLHLQSARSGGTAGVSSVRRGDDTDAALENVQPGTYFARAFTIRGYVSSMTSGSIDLLRNPLTVADGGTADPIDVTLRDDGATVSGTVEYGSGSTGTHASLLLVPSDGSSITVQGFAMPDGKFTMANVPPGSYCLFAFSGMQGQQLPYRDPEAMRTYAGRGTSLSVTAGQKVTANANLIDFAETK